MQTQFVKYPRKVKNKRKTKPKTRQQTVGLTPYELGQQARDTGASNPFDTNSSAGESWQAGFDGE